MGPIAPCSHAGRRLAVASGVPVSSLLAQLRGLEAKPLSLFKDFHEHWELSKSAELGGLGGKDQGGCFLSAL